MQLFFCHRVGNLRKSQLLESHVRAQLIQPTKITDEGEFLHFDHDELVVSCQILRYDIYSKHWKCTILFRSDLFLLEATNNQPLEIFAKLNCLFPKSVSVRFWICLKNIEVIWFFLNFCLWVTTVRKISYIFYSTLHYMLLSYYIDTLHPRTTVLPIYAGELDDFTRRRSLPAALAHDREPSHRPRVAFLPNGSQGNSQRKVRDTRHPRGNCRVHRKLRAVQVLL